MCFEVIHCHSHPRYLKLSLRVYCVGTSCNHFGCKLFKISSHLHTQMRCYELYQYANTHTYHASLNQQNVVPRIFKICWDWISLTSSQPALVLRRFYHISSWDHAMMLWMSRHFTNWVLHMCCSDCICGKRCFLQDPGKLFYWTPLIYCCCMLVERCRPKWM